VNTNAQLAHATDCEGGGGGGSKAAMYECMIGVTPVRLLMDRQHSYRRCDHNIVLFIGTIVQSKIDNGFGVFFSKPIASDTLTLTGQTWSSGSLVQILVL
jgi:hypothetical protein